MKSSELIRNAVDKYLWSGLDPRPTDVYISEHICNCLHNYAKRDMFFEDWQEALKLFSDIETFIHTLIFEERQALKLSQCNVLPFPESNILEYKQAIRYMFAEFLALYFEDQGD